MSYKHILVAVDLSKSSEQLIDKAVSLAKDANAKLSFVFVDVDNVYENVYKVGDENLEVSPLPSGEEREKAIEERENTLQEELQKLADQADYPIENAIVVMGDLNNKLLETVQKMDIDLLICGHHHDFWSRLLSSVRQLVNSVGEDLLIVHLED